MVRPARKITKPKNKVTLKTYKKGSANKVVKSKKQVWSFIVARYSALIAANKSFKARRPHRSLRRTLRRDYIRSLKLPGYIAFTAQVNAVLRKHSKTLILLVIFYTLLMLVLGGVTSQDSYSQINKILQESSGSLFTGGIGQVGEAGLLLVSTFAGGPADLSADQQIFLSIVVLFVWLTTVWLLREYLIGRKPRLRDGLYNAGAPALATVAVLATFVLQLLPVGLAALIYSALAPTGLIAEGFGSMIFWVLAACITALSFYWATSTALALVIVTLPGTYPMKAIKAAGDLVVGRRLRILYRLLWAIGAMLAAWAVVMVPLVLLETFVKSVWPAVEGVPVMPFAAALMSALTTVWMCSYIYLLYRKIIDDDAKPAL